MRRMRIYVIGLLFLLSAGLLNVGEAHQEGNDDGNNVDASIRRLISTVDPERMSKNLFYLSKDPLPYRKLNLTLPGHEEHTPWTSKTAAQKAKTRGDNIVRYCTAVGTAYRNGASNCHGM